MVLTSDNRPFKGFAFQWWFVFRKRIDDGRIIALPVSPIFIRAIPYFRVIAAILHNLMELAGQTGLQSRILPTTGLMLFHGLLTFKCPASALVVTEPICYLSWHRFSYVKGLWGLQGSGLSGHYSQTS